MYLAAMYLRLSRDDEDIDGTIKSESDSIGSQRELIKDFISEHGNIELYDIYIDDGYSGSNFKRPEFKRMLEDAKAGRLNCIIVKDLSRFGRDYIESGRFIQKIFPAYSIRFIAITDCYDSLTSDFSESAIVLPVKNFINDAYCRDISMKVRTHQQIKRKNGEFIGAFAAYGYLKDPENKNHLVVDPYAAEAVKRIFLWKIQGHSAYAIAKRLDSYGFLPPAEYKKLSQQNKYQSGFSCNPTTKWSSVAVKRILTNKLYLGHLVQGKNEKLNYKLDRRIDKPESEWIVVEHTHKPIVSKEDFAIVQELLLHDVRENRKKEINPFTGLIFCKDCKEQMVKRINRNKRIEKAYYICSTYNRGEGCTRHSILAESLDHLVLTVINKYCTLFFSQSHFNIVLDRAGTGKNISLYFEDELKKLEREWDKYNRLRLGLPKDYQKKVITEQDFMKLDEIYQMKTDELSHAIESQKSIKKRLKKAVEKTSDNLELFKSSIQFEQLERYLLVCFISRILIAEDKSIEIEFSFKNKFFDSCEKERIAENENNSSLHENFYRGS